MSDTDKELAGSYNTAQLLDDIVRLHVKALGFETNRNNFRFKRSVVERSHKTAFGSAIPAWKSFEGKQVNRNHLSKDNGARTNEPIGYIERSYLKNDGVYLDLVLWKRCLSDGELSQLRNRSTHVSMEVEYTKPVLENGVRTMAEDSVVSFVGIAVLFDGIQPGDQTSGVKAVENASLQEQPEFGQPTVERTLYVTDEVSFADSKETEMSDLTPEQREALNRELSDVREQLQKAESEKAELLAAKEAAEAAREQAEVTQKDLEAKVKERDCKLNELLAKESEYQALLTELAAMREKAFQENLNKVISVDALADCEKTYVKALFSDLYGSADAEAFVARAVSLVKITKAASQSVLDKACACGDEGKGEGAGDGASENSNQGAGDPAGDTPVTPEPAPSIASTPSGEKVAPFTLDHLR